ncbi:unnamed protein product [Eruca vesicaria subsp. sativa]|uniref:RING-type domain-containing protein n=1 Tax=Eruca vesicaria subsp. sativa TaxID=29727 RepID=A0ABC8JYZ9_ERUVS|nr:unnamed protein product [Eruca vesicaria subsp. sativa]
MISDSIANASPNAKKKKKNNKSAKMIKLGLRRDQWLSQVAVTNKECKDESREKPDHRVNPLENLDRLGREENLHHESFMESPSSSSMGGTDILTNFSERSSRRSSSSSGSSSEDDGCVDDWEALADALEAEEEEENEKKKLKEEENVAQSSGLDVVGVGDAASAWRQDDDHRPQGLLPNLGKQLSFPELDKRFAAVSMIPSSCPICYEDLDYTDSCFFPCPCGFRLCLFCHKTISDGDGRCPGCRKPYERFIAETSLQDGGLTVRLTRSSRMF